MSHDVHGDSRPDVDHPDMDREPRRPPTIHYVFRAQSGQRVRVALCGFVLRPTGAVRVPSDGSGVRCAACETVKLELDFGNS